ncbi:hypothetical protein SAMN04487910_3046 [Aquimarina amphilecti]|uniref:Uncharacterized protein n=1 Tax=Aquimarina amphilecti TaxID=1038014 RepID=A0A1H7SBC5_AQUAM|nr:hypothetical protein [Aquimarina amphilecti]SEL68837.1 hypothetical protein SAMN04487910_3046 [Aquimarina amphilecti]
MRGSKILFSVLLFICFGTIYSQSIKTPSLSNKKTTKTLIIDSIPVNVSKSYRLSGISNNDNDYRLFFGVSRITDYPSFGISRTRPFLVVANNAFTHKSLFDPVVNLSLGQQSWDNPLNSDSFGAGIIAGSLQLISGFFN